MYEMLLKTEISILSQYFIFVINIEVIARKINQL